MIIHLDECESTHKFMREKATELPAWAVVVAEFQSGGHGRHGRAWIAPKGKNLCFNILLPTEKLEPELYAPTTQIAAITLAKMLRKIGIEANIKWPNDILVNKHKICGIISEFICEKISIGIGLNVNTEKSDFADLDRPATSIFIEKGEIFDKNAILQEFLTEFKANFEALREKGLLPFIEEWRKMGCFIGYKARIGYEEGTIEAVQDDGTLLFRTKNGLKTVWSGDLEI
ncbi:MAG: biotin--[acetyl-CoA-carboxylase] ligase [Fibromonadales bacterium]|nr:biotin--[acetyl-CoA-carboxylase] ligase [Fibromonadales bacterium]